MSSHSSSFTSSSYSFSSSSSNTNGQTTGTTRTTQSHTNPNGTTVRTTSQNMGGPSIEETRHYDNQGREQLGLPAASSFSSTNQRRLQDIEVEDVTDEPDADKKYREAMEDEYAKREGGA